MMKESIYRAHSLTERHQLIRKSNIEAVYEPSEIARYWRSSPPFENHPHLFKKRLLAEDISELNFNFLTSKSANQSLSGEKEFQWQTYLSEAITSYQDISNELGALPPILDKGIRTADFLNVVEPLLLKGFTEFKEQASSIYSKYKSEQQIDTNRIHTQLYQELAARCAMICSRSMVLELQIAKLEKTLQGDSSEARYQSFINGLSEDKIRARLLSDYPVMTRLIVETIVNWSQNCLRLLNRLFEDWTAISDHFFDGHPHQLCAIQTSAGDTHKKGQTVSIFEFSSGAKIVYKPRSVEIETAFGKLLQWLNKKGFSPTFKALKTLNFTSHGWVEFAEHSPARSEAEIRRFYQRQGGLLALLYALEANDFHYENIIAQGEHPILVDLETLFHPWIEDLDDEAAANAPASALKKTVLATGLLPRRIWTQQGTSDGIDLSGFTEVQDQLTPTPVLDIEHIGTDNMVFVRKKVPFSGATNMPKLLGKKIRSLDYGNEIEAGFTALYKLLLDNNGTLIAENGPLSWFKGVETRVIFRETRSYASFLLESLHPDFLGDALERDIFFDQLWVAVEHKSYLGHLIKHEQQALRRMDVPIFNTLADSCDLSTDSGVTLKAFFQESGISRVRKKLRQLSDNDLQRQTWVIRSTLLSADLSNRHAQHSPILKYTLPKKEHKSVVLKAVIDLCNSVEQLAFRNNGGASWFTWKAVGNSHWDLEAMDATFYDGLTGMALFFAYAGHTLKEPHYRRLAEESLTTARYLWEHHPDDIKDIGLFSGWGGLIYTLCHLSSVWQVPSLLEEAFRLQEHIGEGIDDDVNNDIVGGCAGAIIALLTLHAMRPDPTTKELAIACGQRLIARQVTTPQGAGWILEAAGNKVLAGMSHGTAGISVALALLFKETGDQTFLKACNDAIRYEQSLFSVSANNWPDLRAGARPETSEKEGEQYFMTAWCHGAPGIGLARLHLKQVLQEDTWDREIHSALNQTLKSGFLDNHCLCHGSLGNLDVLLEAGNVMSTSDYQEQALMLAAQIAAGQSKTGWLSGYMYNLETPGFMVGLAGMGYQLLRAAFPREVPSVLNFKSPC